MLNPDSEQPKVFSLLVFNHLLPFPHRFLLWTVSLPPSRIELKGAVQENGCY